MQENIYVGIFCSIVINFLLYSLQFVSKIAMPKIIRWANNIQQNYYLQFGLFGSLTHPMLCYCDIEEKGSLLLCISKWLRRETIE